MNLNFFRFAASFRMLDFFILFCASIFAIHLGHKGFAGFDLSPMISSNNLINRDIAQSHAIHNPMPPGFTLIVYLFTLFSVEDYQSYFNGNALFIATLYITGTIVIFITNKYKPIANTLRLFLLSILIPTLITDGHFYISDTSNVLCCYFVFLTANLIFSDQKNKIKFTLGFVILTTSPLMLFVKPNIGLPSFLLVLFFLLHQLLSLKVSNKIFIFLTASFIIPLSVYFWAQTLETVTNYRISDYIESLKLIIKSRSSLDLQLIDISIRFALNRADNLHRLINLILIGSIFIYSLNVYVFTLFKKWNLKNNINHFLFFLPTLFLFISFNTGKFSGAIFLAESFCMLFFAGVLDTEKSSNDTFRKIILLTSFFCFGLTSIICMSTNYDVKSSDFNIVLSAFFLFLLFAKSDDHKNEQSPHTFKSICKLLIVISLALILEGALRIKLSLAGPPATFNQFNVTLNDIFFNQLNTTQYHKKVNDELDFLLKDENLSSKVGLVFFGPRLEYAYQKYKTIPLADLPLWWHFGTSYHEEDINQIEKTFCKSNITHLFFTKIGNEIDLGLMDQKTRKLFVNSELFEVNFESDNLISFRRSKNKCAN